MTETVTELRDDIMRGVELGPAMQACSVRERRFAYAITMGLAETLADAARLAGYGVTDAAIQVTSSRLMHRERVIAAIEECARREFRGMIIPALKAARRLLTHHEHPDHAKTVTTMLSRLGFGERTSVDVKVSGEVQVNHTDAAIEDLRRLKALGVPHEKLIEVFGFSGLGRYEAMLAERDARAPKVIEHRPDETPAGSVEQHHNPMDGTS